jgi:hypothetical protein
VIAGAAGTLSSSRAAPRWLLSSSIPGRARHRLDPDASSRRIARRCRTAGIDAEVLPENAAMIKVFGKFGFSPPRAWIPDTPSGAETRLEAASRARARTFRSGGVVEDAAPAFASGTPVRAYLSPKGERR